jgi:adenylosuccinate lyase
VLHERVRIHSQAGTDALLDRIAADPLFGIDHATIERMARPDDYTGLAKQQTERFLIEEIDPLLEAHRAEIHDRAAEVRV